MDFIEDFALRVRVKTDHVEGAVKLMRSGASVPYISKYKGIVTGNLGESRLITIYEQVLLQAELNARRTAILSSISAQEKLTPELKSRIEKAKTKFELESHYAPFAPNARSEKQNEALAKGLHELANIMLSGCGSGKPEEVAATFLSAERHVKETSEAIEGAIQLLAMQIAWDADLRSSIKVLVEEKARLKIEPQDGIQFDSKKYGSIEGLEDTVKSLAPGQCILALRGKIEQKLQIAFVLPEDEIVQMIETLYLKPDNQKFHSQIATAIKLAFNDVLRPLFVNEILNSISEIAESAIADQLGRNLRNLLMQPPATNTTVLAVAPVSRKSIAVVVLGESREVLAAERLEIKKTAKPQESGTDVTNVAVKEEQQGEINSRSVVDTLTNSAENSRNPDSASLTDLRQAAKQRLSALAKAHGIEVIVFGHSQSGQELDLFLREITRGENALPNLKQIPVSDAGVSMYSTSRSAQADLPDLDNCYRVAVAIGRRFQDPLIEYARHHPKFIGITQSAAELNSRIIKRRIEEVIASCVNRVGVDLNTAPASVLSYVSGIGEKLANSIVKFRQEKGPFISREQLKDVPGITPQALELCSGFFRVFNGENPLDATSIHPDQYELVQRMAESIGLTARELPGNSDALAKINLHSFKTESIDEHMLKDILFALRRGGTDSRGRYKLPRYPERSTRLEDLKEGSIVESVVSNIASFGVFVDIGLMQDGLIHISQLSEKFIRDPAEFFVIGQVIRAKIIKVEPDKKRISLSLKDVEASVQRRSSGRRAEGQRRVKPVPEKKAEASASKEALPAQSEHKPDRRKPKAEPKPAPAPVQNFSKFFDKGSRRKKEQKVERKENVFASRDEVRNVLKQQEKRSGNTLGDLLKNAGFDTE